MISFVFSPIADDHHDLDVLGHRILLERARDLPARLAGHHHVEQHEVGLLALGELERAVCRRSAVDDLVAALASRVLSIVTISGSSSTTRMLAAAPCVMSAGYAARLPHVKPSRSRGYEASCRRWLWLAIAVVIGVAALSMVGDVAQLGDRLAGFHWWAFVRRARRSRSRTT